MKTTESAPVKPANDFSGRNLKSEMSWLDWKKRWNEEMERESPSEIILAGLLHGVLGARTETPEEFDEVFDFCLDIADGFKYYSEHETSIEATRRNIAKKAWKTLLLGFLRNLADGERDEYDRERWNKSFFTKHSVISKLLWFYGSEKNNLPKRYPQEFAEKVAKNFAMNFSRFVLDHHSSGFCRENQPKIVEILHRIGSLDILLEPDREISSEAMAKLRELALSEVKTPPEPESDIDAYIRGSETAKYHILLDLKRGLRAQQRFDEIVGGRDVPM